MKRIRLRPLTLGLAVFIICSAAAAESVESDLQTLLKQFVRAWDKSEPQAIAALFEGDSDLVIPTGLLIEGKGSIENFYASAFEHGYRGSRASASIRHIRQVKPEMVIVDGEWRIDGAIIDGRLQSPEVGIFSLIARRQGGRWAISSLREQDGAHSLTRLTEVRETRQSSQSPAGSSVDTAATDSVDLNAIKRLEDEDIAASRKNDVAGLVALWTDDGVLIQPGTAPVVGKIAIRELLVQQRMQAGQIQTLSYDEKWNEVRIEGRYAFEWGQISATVKLPNAQEVQQSVNAIRVLARQSDGSWRFARVSITPASKR